MKKDPAKFPSPARAAARLRAQAAEFVVVRNPSYVFPAEELYPLAPALRGPVSRLAAVVQDMDGTTTTTETLCLHSLETMVRRVTGRLTAQAWRGLDRERDYPRIIGNSTTRHVEYLVETYGPHIRSEALVPAMLAAAAWTLVEGQDPGRRREVRATLSALGWSAALDAIRVWRKLLNARTFDTAAAMPQLARLAAQHAAQLPVRNFNERVRICVDIYYARYHEILKGIAAGRGPELARELTAGRPLIEPMPGAALFQTLIRGWLGARAAELYDWLRAATPVPLRLPPPAVGRRKLAALGRRFQRRPLKVAVVTSSIAYEANIVLGEVVRAMRRQMADWPACDELAARLDSPASLFDAVVTASDSSEIRLKPHRDLYSIALHALGLAPRDFPAVLGFEDSESGVVAIRAAGIGLCVAVPFADTAGHDLSAAAHVLHGGLPQAILEHNLFL
jgi:beta-phosphoglucomutase-like phosphatase (HAD superfamily)